MAVEIQEPDTGDEKTGRTEPRSPISMQVAKSRYHGSEPKAQKDHGHDVRGGTGDKEKNPSGPRAHPTNQIMDVFIGRSAVEIQVPSVVAEEGQE